MHFVSACHARRASPIRSVSRAGRLSIGYVGALVILGVAVVGAVVFFSSVIYVSIEAEKTHIAYRETLESLRRYVESTHGQWPRSWEELADFALDKDPSRYWRFKDLADLRGRVHVRFDATMDEVAESPTDAFSIVTPIGPNFGDDPRLITDLKDAARRAMNLQGIIHKACGLVAITESRSFERFATLLRAAPMHQTYGRVPGAPGASADPSGNPWVPAQD